MASSFYVYSIILLFVSCTFVTVTTNSNTTTIAPPNCETPKEITTIAKKMAALGPDYDKKLALGILPADGFDRACLGIYYRIYMKELMNGPFNQSEVEAFIPRAFPHAVNLRRCPLTKTYKNFAKKMAEKGPVIDFVETFKEVANKNGIDDEELWECDKTIRLEYKKAFQRAGFYKDEGRDWLDANVYLLPSNLFNRRKSRGGIRRKIRPKMR